MFLSCEGVSFFNCNSAFILGSCSTRKNAGKKPCIFNYIHQHMHIYRVSKEERSIFWEVIVSVMLSKNVYMNMCPIPNGFRDRARRTAKVTANRSSKHFLSHVQKRPQGLTRLLSKVTSETSRSKSTKLAICFNLVTMLRSRGDGSSLNTSDFSLLWITMRTWPSLIMHASN